MMRTFAAVLVMIAAASGAQAQERTPITYKVPMPADAVNAALGAFADACSPLVDKYWADVVSSSVTVSPIYSSRVERLGSTKQIEVDVALADNLKAVPQSMAKAHRAWGQRCQYYLFGGQQPRIETAKDICKALCGLDPAASGSGNAMISAPGLAVIEGGR